MFAKTIGITFKNSNFNSYSAQETLENATDNTKEILKVAYKVFENSYKQDEIRLIGVRLANLMNNRNEQVSLFDKEDNLDHTADIQKTIDEINNKFGKSLIKPASLKVIGDAREKKSYME